MKDSQSGKLDFLLEEAMDTKKMDTLRIYSEVKGAKRQRAHQAIADRLMAVHLKVGTEKTFAHPTVAHMCRTRSKVFDFCNSGRWVAPKRGNH